MDCLLNRYIFGSLFLGHKYRNGEGYFDSLYLRHLTLLWIGKKSRIGLPSFNLNLLACGVLLLLSMAEMLIVGTASRIFSPIFPATENFSASDFSTLALHCLAAASNSSFLDARSDFSDSSSCLEERHSK